MHPNSLIDINANLEPAPSNWINIQYLLRNLLQVDLNSSINSSFSRFSIRKQYAWSEAHCHAMGQIYYGLQKLHFFNHHKHGDVLYYAIVFNILY